MPPDHASVSHGAHASRCRDPYFGLLPPPLRGSRLAAGFEGRRDRRPARCRVVAVGDLWRPISPRRGQGARRPHRRQPEALNDLISEAAERDICVTLEPETIKVDRLDARVAPTLYKLDMRKVLL
jgi:hypothetical protein